MYFQQTDIPFFPDIRYDIFIKNLLTNAYRKTREHGEGNQKYFVSCSDEAVENGFVRLTELQLRDLIFGAGPTSLLQHPTAADHHLLLPKNAVHQWKTYFSVFNCAYWKWNRHKWWNHHYRKYNWEDFFKRFVHSVFLHIVLCISKGKIKKPSVFWKAQQTKPYRPKVCTDMVGCTSSLSKICKIRGIRTATWLMAMPNTVMTVASDSHRILCYLLCKMHFEP